MHVHTVPNRKSRPDLLLRESYREGGNVKKRILANLTGWPGEKATARSRRYKHLSVLAVQLPDAHSRVSRSDVASP